MSQTSARDDEIPEPEPLNSNRNNTKGMKKERHRMLSAPEQLNNNSSSQHSDNMRGSGSTHRGENSLLARVRAQTALANVSKRFGNTSLKGAKSFRGVTGAVGDLIIPSFSFKTNWSNVINNSEAGKKRSIAAFATAFLLTLGFGFIFFTSFTKLDPYYGAADRTFENLSGLEEYSIPLFIAGGAGMFFFVVFDFYFATNKAVKAFGLLLLISSIIVFIIGIMFQTVENVLAPILLLFFLVPVLLLLVKKIIFPTVSNKWYLLAVAISLVIISGVTMASFLFWLFTEEAYFTEENVEEEYFAIVNCNFSLVNGTREDCPQAFLVYVLPLVISVYCFVFSNILTFTIRAEEKKKNDTLDKPIEPLAQIFIITTVLGIVATWVTASLFAAEVAEVSSDVLYLSLIALVTIAIIVFSVFDVKSLREKLLVSPLGVKVVQLSDSEWVDAFVVFLALPLVVIYFILSFITQSIRRFTPLGKELEKADEKNWAFVKESQYFVKRMMDWDLGSLLTKVLNLGVIWFIFVIVIGRVVNVFLSFLSEFLAEFSLIATSGIFIATGLALFLLPPVPGLPIYLTGGILLSQSARNNGFNFGAAGAYSIAICSVIKMLSIIVQQKIIGQTLGKKSVAIRSACQLNSLELRAMKRIMSVPGLSIPKVAVLVGGPDWPTSVLTGLMGLPLGQMLLGSVPVLVTIVPVCYAGAVLIEGEDSPLAPLNAILLSVSLVVQLTPFFIAIHYIAKAAIDYAEELELEELDQEVLAYEEKHKEKKEWKILLTRWKNLSMLGKCCHIFFTGLMIISNMAFTFAGDLNFESFDVTDTIDNRLDGNVFNLLKPFGYSMMGLFAAAFLYLFIFNKIQSQRVAYKIKKKKVIPEAEKPEINDDGFASLQYYSTRYIANRNIPRVNIDDDDDASNVDELSKRSKPAKKMPFSRRQKNHAVKDMEEII